MLRLKFGSKAIKLRAVAKVNCFTSEGIDAIKAALIAGREQGTAECPIHIGYIPLPLETWYSLTATTTSLPKKEALEILQRACDAVCSVIKKGEEWYV